MKRSAVFLFAFALGLGVTLALMRNWRTPVEVVDPRPQNDTAHVAPVTESEQAGGTPDRKVLPEQPNGARPDRPTLRFLVRDAQTRAPIGGVRLVSAKTAEFLGQTDAAGQVMLRDVLLSHVVFVADGHLIAFWPQGTPGHDRLEQQIRTAGVGEVDLQADRFTVPCRLRFVEPDGKTAAQVEFRLVPLEQPPPSAASFPRARIGDSPVEPRLMDAWRQHALIAALPNYTSSLQHFGIDSAHKRFSTAGEVTIQCIATGPYLLEAQSGNRTASEQIFVALGQTAAQVVRLVDGWFAQGQVVDTATGQGIAEVSVEPKADAMGLAVLSTGADGKFRFGPLSRADLTIHCTHPSYQDHQVVLERGSPVQRIALQKKPLRPVTGVVRGRHGAAPLAGAAVELRSQGVVEARGNTAQDGRFNLQSASEDTELVVRLAGWLEWIEVVEPGGPGLDCVLVPDTAAARVAAGLTATLHGTVRGPDDKPRGMLPVQLALDQAPSFQGIAGRRILRGLLPTLSPIAMTDAKGEFVLEVAGQGFGKVHAIDGDTPTESGLTVQWQSGQEIKGLDLRTRR